MSILDARKTKPVEGGASFTLQNRIARLLWNVTWFLMASWTPPQMRGWRRFILRSFGARIAKTADIYGSARIWLPSNLEMREFANLGPRVNCYCMDKITLDAYAQVSQGAYLCAATHDIDNPHFQLITKPILIGKGAWVAVEAFVGPGVHVGAGAVLGARGVAFRNLEPNTVYVGNPARPLRARRGVGPR